MTKRQRLDLNEHEIEKLNSISKSRALPESKVKRAKIILLYGSGVRISHIAEKLNTNRPLVERVIDKALILDPLAALEDLPREGRPRKINDEAIRWILSITKRNPRDFGYSKKSWTYELLASHLRKNCFDHGHDCLIRLGKGRLHTILTKFDLKLSKNEHNLENNDHTFNQELTRVLCTHKSIEIKNESTVIVERRSSFASSPKKPHASSSEDRSAKSEQNKKPEDSTIADVKQSNQQSVALIAGIDLHTGRVLPMVKDSYHSDEFVEFLELLDCQYPKPLKIQLVLDKNPTYISRELIRYLKTRHGRFIINFAPKQGAWLNLIELFFGRVLQSLVKTMRFQTREEFIAEVINGIEELNRESFVSRWKHRIEDIMV